MPKNDKILVAFSWDCGRMGNVEGLFVTTFEELESAYGQNVYFGEILGKHSAIHGLLKREHITLKSIDQEFIKKLVGITGNTVSGYNPLSYLFGEE